jgi:hypothetical protein
MEPDKDVHAMVSKLMMQFPAQDVDVDTKHGTIRINRLSNLCQLKSTLLY